MLKRSLLTLALLLGAHAFAENEAEGTEENQIATKPADAAVVTFDDSLENELQDFASEHLGKDNYYSAVAVAKIGVAPSSPKYVIARQLTFNEAFSNALQQISSEIRVAMENAVSNGMLSDINGLKKADLDPQIMGLINDEIKKQLTAAGVDLNDPAAVKAAMPKVQASSSFKQTTSAASQLFLSGVVCYKTVARGDEIGVLAYYSPATKKFAETLLTKTPMAKLPAGINVYQYLKSIPANELANTIGPRVYVDQNGQICIVSFAQDPIVGNANLAKVAATRYADSFIQDFVGSKFAMEELLDAAKDSATLVDSLGAANTVADVSQRVKTLAKRSSGKLTYHGIKTALTRTVTLPNRQRAVIIARMWSPALQARGVAASAAADRAEQIRDNIGKKPASKAPTTRRAKPTDLNNTQTQGSGAAGFIL